MRLALLEVSLDAANRLKEMVRTLQRDDVFAVLSLEHTVLKIQSLTIMLEDNFEVLNIQDDSPETVWWYVQTWFRAAGQADRRDQYMAAMEARCETIIKSLRKEEAKRLQAIEYKRIFSQL